MKTLLIKFASLSLLLPNCTNQNSLKKTDKESNELSYPIVIEFGAVGKGSNLPPSVFKINSDSIDISRWNKLPNKGIQSFTIATKETEFLSLIDKLDESDLTGTVDYYNLYIRDGGFMKITTSLGQRKFINTFGMSPENSLIKPDTIGLFKFEQISKYAKTLLAEFPEL